MTKEKESGLTKLIELLNEYEAKLEEMPLARRKWREESGILYRRFMNVEDAERMVISKSFGFIKWLVENNKIDIESYCRITSIERKGEKDVYRDEVDSLLMLLAIKDEPIRFLCEIIK